MSQTAQQPGQLTLVNVRLAFPVLFTPESVKGDPNGKPRYGATLLIPKSDTKTYEAIKGEIDRLAKEAKLTKGFEDKDICLGDGDRKEYAGYSGHWYLTANRAESQGRPTVVDRSKNPIAANDNAIYGGVYVNAVVRIYKPKDWKKACASLEIIQKVKDGEPFGSARASTDLLPDLPDDGSDGLDPDDV